MCRRRKSFIPKGPRFPLLGLVSFHPSYPGLAQRLKSSTPGATEKHEPGNIKSGAGSREGQAVNHRREKPQTHEMDYSRGRLESTIRLPFQKPLKQDIQGQSHSAQALSQYSKREEKTWPYGLPLGLSASRVHPRPGAQLVWGQATTASRTWQQGKRVGSNK